MATKITTLTGHTVLAISEVVGHIQLDPSGFNKILFDEARDVARDVDSEKSKKMSDVTSIKITNTERQFIAYPPAGTEPQ